MVKITNGQQVLTVTRNAFNEVFKRSGYRLYSDDVQAIAAAPQRATEPMKPISQWTRKDLVEYITAHGGKAEGKTDELRDMVKHHMEEAE
jgi:hypothetical protein